MIIKSCLQRNTKQMMYQWYNIMRKKNYILCKLVEKEEGIIKWSSKEQRQLTHIWRKYPYPCIDRELNSGLYVAIGIMLKIYVMAGRYHKKKGAKHRGDIKDPALTNRPGRYQSEDLLERRERDCETAPRYHRTGIPPRGLGSMGEVRHPLIWTLGDGA